ncbi:hypothetical protein BH23PLA1_BH23PLA1_28990 [soil metagenome]
MKLGLLADIHEHVEHLEAALSWFDREGVEQVVVLGDVFEMGNRLDETTRLLIEAGAVGVWGNHDFGLCKDPEPDLRARYSAEALDFLATLQPRLEIEGCLFTHVEPWLDPENVLDLWFYEGSPETPERLAQSFEAVEHPYLFVGHFHRWMAGGPEGLRPWRGEIPWRGQEPITLPSEGRSLVVVGPVCAGKCGTFDTATGRLVPRDLIDGY